MSQTIDYSPTEREQIIELRIKLIDELIEFFPFFLKKSLTENKLTEFTDLGDSSSISEELLDKNNLLEEVGLKVNNIYKKLKEKFDV